MRISTCDHLSAVRMNNFSLYNQCGNSLTATEVQSGSCTEPSLSHVLELLCSQEWAHCTQKDGPHKIHSEPHRRGLPVHCLVLVTVLCIYTYDHPQISTAAYIKLQNNISKLMGKILFSILLPINQTALTHPFIWSLWSLN